jgi:putative ABC transport system ATP-binding protein
MLELANVSKTYELRGAQVITAIQGVSTVFRPRELVGIVGPSGSGKTTLLMMAGLVDAPSHGAIHWNGHTLSAPGVPPDRLRDFRRHNVGFVFQRANLIPFLTAVENVAVPMELNSTPSAVARRNASELLEQLGLRDRLNSFPHQLSGGEQQRVAIARALANRPSFLFADEPTAALDSGRGRDVMTLFRRLATEHGLAICVVTHDARMMDLFDRIIEMNDGRVTSEYAGHQLHDYLLRARTHIPLGSLAQGDHVADWARP